MAKKNKFDLQRFHFEHNLWLNEIVFVGQEADIFLHLLQEMKIIFPTDTEGDFNETIKRFEHELAHFKRTVADIKSEIHAQEVVMASAIREETKHFNEDIWETQVFLREKMDYFHDNYRKLKVEFRLFVGKDLESHFAKA
jgi:hypothetical protein